MGCDEYNLGRLHVWESGLLRANELIIQRVRARQERGSERDGIMTVSLGNFYNLVICGQLTSDSVSSLLLQRSPIEHRGEVYHPNYGLERTPAIDCVMTSIGLQSTSDDGHASN